MVDRLLDWEFPAPWPYEAVVVARNDPKGLARVKLSIPGEIDETDWVLPLGLPGAGGSRRGTFLAPPIGADVAVLFIGGDRENPRYIAGHYGEDEPPETGAIEEDGGDNTVWQDEKVRIEIDSRNTTAGVRIVDRATGGAVKLELDIAGQTATLESSIGVRIKAKGTVAIEGSVVTVAGRVVAPIGPPI